MTDANIDDIRNSSLSVITESRSVLDYSLTDLRMYKYPNADESINFPMTVVLTIENLGKKFKKMKFLEIEKDEPEQPYCCSGI